MHAPQPATSPADQATTTERVAGYTVTARGGRVYVWPVGEAGALTPERAWELASAIHNAATTADAQDLAQDRAALLVPAPVPG